MKKIGLDMQDTHKWPVSTILAHTTQQFVYFGLSTDLLKRSVLLFACFKNAVIKIDNYSNSLGQKFSMSCSLEAAENMSKILLSSLCGGPRPFWPNTEGQNQGLMFHSVQKD